MVQTVYTVWGLHVCGYDNLTHHSSAYRWHPKMYRVYIFNSCVFQNTSQSSFASFTEKKMNQWAIEDWSRIKVGIWSEWYLIDGETLSTSWWLMLMLTRWWCHLKLNAMLFNIFVDNIVSIDKIFYDDEHVYTSLCCQKKYFYKKFRDRSDIYTLL